MEKIYYCKQEQAIADTESSNLCRLSIAFKVLKGGGCNMDLKDLPGVAALPILRLSDKYYFIDLYLKQFREVENPSEFVDFNSQDGKVLRKYAKIVSCRCGFYAIVARPAESNLCCYFCGHTLE